jgi:Nitroreductase
MLVSCTNAQDLKPIKLNAPDLSRGEKVMKALFNRKSTREYSDKKLTLQDLSDLLWAANGINRPKEGKRTAPSAYNKQDIKVYVCMAEGNYLYNAASLTLTPVSKGDVRPMKAPVCLVLVSDTDQSWGVIDAGIVSQNISLFCSGVGLATVPRIDMDKDKLKRTLRLSGKQTLILNHPVGYFK